MMLKRLSLLSAGAGVVALLLLFPVIHVALALANFAVHLIVLGLQLITTRLPHRRARMESEHEVEPFVSIHVPAHNEPPEVLKETLRALSRLKWRNFEVLVIDNNTTDPAMWKPVEDYCDELGPRFRFIHVENLRGFKAGALNYVRRFMDRRADFIFVVDADYVVDRTALRRAFQSFSDPEVALVQFPQDYRNVGRGNAGVALDFKHFFAGYMNMANYLGCVPSTGTLSLIRVSALAEVGGFDTQVVTEDAELGFRLNARGYRTLYVNEVIGRGLMPHDLESLKNQRWRWAFGNAQILKLNWKSLLFGPNLTWRQKLGYLIHLTAWFNFNLIPSLTLILVAPLALLERMHPLHPYLVVVSGFTLTTFMVLRFGTMFYSLRHDGHNLREIWLAFLTHLGLGWVFGASWLKCLFDHRSPFVRTNKFLARRMPNVLRTTLAEVSLGVCLLAACAVLALTDFVVGPVAALLMCGARFLIYWVWWQMRYTLKLTVHLARQTEMRLFGTADETLEASLSDAAN
jgi:cellulose synthase/poly-beta-1,6-N-acetylglucosamine synthase-like glycosyltransferase